MKMSGQKLQWYESTSFVAASYHTVLGNVVFGAYESSLTKMLKFCLL